MVLSAARAYVHGHDIPGGNDDNLPVISSMNGMQVESRATIQPNHVWLGVSEEPTPAEVLRVEQAQAVEAVKAVATKYASE